MRHIDLFSGIGGFSLAADRAFGDVEHIFVEYDPFCQAVLSKHWPSSKIYGNIKEFSKEQFTTDTRSEESGGISQQPREEGFEIGDIYLLTGGFPCQPFSQAGRRQGMSDDRYLWPEMFRIIREFKPTWIVAENVRGLATWSDGMVLEQVCSDLESEGYEVQPVIIPAVALNAPHRRDRIWFIAHANGNKYRGRGRSNGEADGLQGINRKEVHSRGIGGTDKDASYTSDNDRGSRFKCGKEKTIGTHRNNEFTRSSWNKNWIEVATRFCGMDDGIPRRLDRASRLKALGNAIVPQVAEEIFKTFKLTPSHT